LIFYVGGGITKDSNPETEFEETQRKFQTVFEAISQK
jgi:isochorismate synthase EntC